MAHVPAFGSCGGLMTSPDSARAPQSVPVTVLVSGSIRLRRAGSVPTAGRGGRPCRRATAGDEDRSTAYSSELATNAVRHGGGSGRLRLWTDDQVLVCEVSDTGAGITDPNPGEPTRP